MIEVAEGADAIGLDTLLWERVDRLLRTDLYGEARYPVSEVEAREYQSRLRMLHRSSMLWTYRPYEKQGLFLRASNPVKILCGGNQVGKTTTLLAEVLSYCLGYRPWELDFSKDGESPTSHEFHPVQAMVAANDFVNAHTEVVVPKIKQLIPFDYLVESVDRIQGKVIHKIHFWNGSTLKLMGYEQSSDKYEGPVWDVVGLDEPPPRSIYIAIQRGCMSRGASVLMSFTPLKEAWIFDEVYSKGVHVVSGEDFDSREEEVALSPVFSVTIDLEENPYISEVQKKQFIASLDPEERETRVHGKFMHLMGRVYKRFGVDKHVREPEIDESWPVGCVIDPHTRRPFFIGWFVVTPRDEVVWIAEWPDEFLYHECKSYDANIEWYVRRIREIEAGDNPLGFVMKHVEWRVLDPRFGRQPSAVAGLSIQEEFERHGLDFEVDFTDNFDAGRLKLNEYLGTETQEPMMFWYPHVHNMVLAMTHCTWDDWSGKVDRAVKERVKDKFSDGTDVARYGAIWEPKWFDTSRPRGPIDPVGYEQLGLV